MEEQVSLRTGKAERGHSHQPLVKGKCDRGHIKHLNRRQAESGGVGSSGKHS